MPATAPRWTRHFVYRSERTRTTWKLRVGLLTCLALAVWLTSQWWTVIIGRSLVCEASREPSEAILIENFDPHYDLYERATALRRAGLASQIFVPVRTVAGTSRPNQADARIAQVMATLAGVGPFDIIPIREIEPISLNAAKDILAFLRPRHIRSLRVVTPLFRSQRSATVYRATLEPAQIAVYCDPVGDPNGISTWPQTWHGIQQVVEQWLKFQYYRYYVLW